MNKMLMEYVCDELEEVAEKGLTASNIDSVSKLVSMKKDLLKIEKLEEEGYSEDDGMWEARGSYASGNSYAGGGSGGGSGGGGSGGGGNSGYSGARRRRYSRAGNYSMAENATSYARRRDSRGRYSRAEAKDGMMEQLNEMMGEADEKQRGILRRAMRDLENV